MRFSKPSKSLCASMVTSGMYFTVIGTSSRPLSPYRNRRGRDSSTPPAMNLSDWTLNQPLIEHGIGDLEEAADISAVHEIAGRAVLLRRLVAVLVDRDHDLVEPIIDLFASPTQASAVLGHFQTRSGNTASVRGLRWSIENLGFQEQLGRFERAWHVGAFGHDLHTILDEIGRVLGVDFVLRGAREGAIGLDIPERVVVRLNIRRHEECLLELVGVVADASTTIVLEIHDIGQLLAVDAVGIADHAVGVGKGDRLRTQVQQLLHRVLGNIAAAGNQAELAFRRVFAGLQHLRGIVDAAIAGGFGTNQRTAPTQAFAGQHAGEFVGEPLVLAEQEADLASAHADVAGGHVGVGTNVAIEFGHEALAETHDFVVALALGIEIRTTLAAAHGQRGQRILEDLFE